MLPEAKYFKPGNDISWLVKQFETIHFKGKGNLCDKYIPREDAAVIFHFGNLPRMLKPVDQPLPLFFLAPLSPTANQIMIMEETDTLVVTCKPTVLSRVLDISMIADNRVYVPLPDPLFRPLWEEMRKHSDPARRIETFSRFINNLLPGRYKPDKTDILYESIVRKGMKVSLHDIISDFGISERTAQRKLRNRLGITPKKLLRIIRINYLWQKINTSGEIDYQDMVFMGNYFDQTHLIKDFKSITGETPDSFFRRNLGMAKILSGK